MTQFDILYMIPHFSEPKAQETSEKGHPSPSTTLVVVVVVVAVAIVAVAVAIVVVVVVVVVVVPKHPFKRCPSHRSQT